MSRGFFGQLTSYPQFVSSLISELERSGSFTTGIETHNKKGTRGESVNADVYGYEESQRLAVIQVRWCRFRPNHYNQVRKDYYLCGYNESGTVFAHPIDSPARSSKALGSPEDCVRWAECKIFSCTEKQLTKIVRQGDLAFVPAPIPADAEPVPVDRFVIDQEGSHLLQAEHALLADSKLYVRGNASLVHLKGQHAPVSVPSGSWRVQLGYRAKVWGFSSPTRD
jgi:hypothetical protein